jgi:hypothetical protein
MPDVVALNVLSSSVSLLRGKGDGTFDPHEITFVGNVTPRGDFLNFPYPGPFMAAGDLDGDDDLDLAIPCKTEVRVLLNDGFGTFTLAPAHPKIADTRGNAYGVEIADLNNDKNLDIAVAALALAVPDVKALSIMLGKGDGTFAPAVGYDVRTEPIGGALHWNVNVSAGDIDGDGHLDLAVSHEIRSKIALLYNKGDGTFGDVQILPVFDGSWIVRFEHLNDDGRIDLAVLTTAIRAKLCVSLNDGGGGLWTHEDTPPQMQAGGGPPFPWGGTEWVETGDVDLDGDIDVVLANEGVGYPDDGSIVVLFNDGNGRFPAFDAYPIVKDGLGWPTCARLAHLNDDPWPDIIVTDVADKWMTSGRVWVLMATGQGKYAAPVPYVIEGRLPVMADCGDIDGDGDVDVAVWTTEVYPGNDITPVERSVFILLNDGVGTLSIDTHVVAASVPWPFVAGGALLADLNGDKDLDLVATAGTKNAPGMIRFFANLGGQFVSTTTTPVQIHPLALGSADFDHDGDLDILVSRSGLEVDGSVLLMILWNAGDGGIASVSESFDPHASSFRFDIGDLSKADTWQLAIPNDYGTVQVHHGVNSYWSSCDADHSGAGDRTWHAVIADLNGDGSADVVTANNADGNISVLRNVGCASQPCLADCDGSGSLDLFDFLCFVNAYNNGEPAADCDGDGGLTLFDFLCFVNAFNAGCP